MSHQFWRNVRYDFTVSLRVWCSHQEPPWLTGHRSPTLVYGTNNRKCSKTFRRHCSIFTHIVLLLLFVFNRVADLFMHSVVLRCISFFSSFSCNTFVALCRVIFVFSTVLHCIASCCIVLQNVVYCCTLMHNVVWCCWVLNSFAHCCIV